MPLTEKVSHHLRALYKFIPAAQINNETPGVLALMLRLNTSLTKCIENLPKAIELSDHIFRRKLIFLMKF